MFHFAEVFNQRRPSAFRPFRKKTCHDDERVLHQKEAKDDSYNSNTSEYFESDSLNKHEEYDEESSARMKAEEIIARISNDVVIESLRAADPLLHSKVQENISSVRIHIDKEELVHRILNGNVELPISITFTNSDDDEEEDNTS